MIFNLIGRVTDITETDKGTSAKGEWVKTRLIVSPKDSSENEFIFYTFKKVDFQKGSLVDIAFNIKQREHNGKYYTDLIAFQFEVKGIPLPITNLVGNNNPIIENEEPTSDLPF